MIFISVILMFQTAINSPYTALKRLIANNEFERKQKEAIVAWIRSYPGIRQKELRNTT
jgi:Na+/melibiose symporter-like transporter